MNNLTKMAIPGETDKDTRRKFLGKIRLNIFLILFGGFVIGLFLHGLQARSAIEKQKANNNRALSEVVTILEKNVDNADRLTEIFHEGNSIALEDIRAMFSDGFFERIFRSDDHIRAEIFEELRRSGRIPYLYLLSEDGKIVISRDEEMIGLNPAATTHMTQENLNGILSYAKSKSKYVEPVLVRNQHGDYFFYSVPFEYGGVSYVLAIGEDTSGLEEQIDSLRDVSSLISRISVRNNGFIFAVNKSDGLYVYYKDGDVFLSGQSAASTGLSEKALTISGLLI